jgi:hypothetical protein
MNWILFVLIAHVLNAVNFVLDKFLLSNAVKDSFVYTFAIGVLGLAVLVLIKPLRAPLFWMFLWGVWTALLRPIAGEPIWDFIERFANWGAPLALFFLIGRWPKSLKEWFR